MSESKIASRVTQIKNAVLKKRLGFRELSALTGIPTSTLSPIHKDDWNPKLQTLLALEKALFQKPAGKKA